MAKFTCEECLQEKDSFHESLEKNNMCDDCFNELSQADEGYNQWCGCCQMFSHITDSNPYGTCQCS
jgi:hypothetical protein